MAADKSDSPKVSVSDKLWIRLKNLFCGQGNTTTSLLASTTASYYKGTLPIVPEGISIKLL